MKRMKTLLANCKKMGHNVTQPEGLAPALQSAIIYLLIDSSHQFSLNSVPKTGSTTWRFMLLNNSFRSSLDSFKNILPGQKLILVHLNEIYKKSFTSMAKLMQPSEVWEALMSYYNVLTVRHPFDRLESTCNNKIRIENIFPLRKMILAQQKTLASLSHRTKSHTG